MTAFAGDGRAPGCVVKGCAEVPRRGALVCDLHGRLLADAAKRAVPPATFSHPEPSTVDGVEL